MFRFCFFTKANKYVKMVNTDRKAYLREVIIMNGTFVRFIAAMAVGTVAGIIALACVIFAVSIMS